MTIHPVVLAGGSGTRLWPMSREHHPKQFLPLMGERTMLQETLCRLDGVNGVAPPVIVCNETHRFLVLDQVRELDKQPLAVIVEPAGRNTAPALTLAALRLSDMGPGSNAEPVLIMMPADHVIRDVDAFQTVVETGASLAESGQIVTFGVVPNAPVTGYGYIHKGEGLGATLSGQGREVVSSLRKGGQDGTATSRVAAHRALAFVEKPDQDTARAYVESGGFLWNSGIFMMHASVWLSELERNRPDILAACRAAHSNGDVDGDFFRPGAAEFIACPSESIDYAVMEKTVEDLQDAAVSRAGPTRELAKRASGCTVVTLDAGWSDIGAWSALWEEREQDSDGNVIQGDVYTHSTVNALLIAQHRLLATVGLEEVVVVETSDAVLVARKDRVQDVKEIVQRLKVDSRTESESHREVHRPWGAYEVVDAGRGFQVKRLTVNAGAALSLQRHQHRAEHWVVVSGAASVTRGEEVFTLNENQSTYVPKGVTHRIHNTGDMPLEIIEVQSGEDLGEDDIERFEDSYNRHKQR